MARSGGGQLNIRSRIDNSGLRRDAQETVNTIKGVTKEVSAQSDIATKALGTIGKAAAGIFTLQQGKELVMRVVETRGQFQQLEIAFETLAGSADKAQALMSQLIDSAAKTPFDLTGIAEGAKLLMAYGTEVENVNDTLLMLGDIASGLSVPLGDLVYLYGTTMAQGRLFTMDLRQFMGRGVPLAKELAKQFGVAESAVEDLITAGKVGAAEFDKAIRSIAGGQFNNLMEKQSKSLTGQIANLEDAVEVMLNNIGKAHEGTIGNVIAFVSELVENYEKVGRAIAELVVTVGVYKTALIIVSNLQKGWTLAMQAHYATLVITEKAQKLLNATMLKNPYVAVTALVVGMAYSLYKYATATSEAEEAHKKFVKSVEEGKAQVDAERVKVDTLFATMKHAKEGTQEYKQAKDTILSQYGQYLKGLGNEIETLRDVEGAYKAITAAAIESANARAIQQATQTAQDSYIEQMTNVGESVREVMDKVRRTNSLTTEEITQMELAIRGYVNGQEKSLKLTERQKNVLTNIKDFNLDATNNLLGSIAVASSKAREARNEYSKALYQAKKDFPLTGLNLQKEEEAPIIAPTTIDEKEAKNARKKQEKRLKAIREYGSELEKLQRDTELEILQATIEAKEEGLQKELDTNEYNHQRRTHQISTLARDWVKQYEQAYGVEGATIADLTQQQQDMLVELQRQADEKKVSDDARVMSDLLEQYATYGERRARLVAEYKKKEEDIRRAGGSDKNVEELNRERDDAVQSLDKEFASREATFSAWMNKVSKLTLGQLKTALAEAKKALERAEGEGVVSDEDLARVRAEVFILEEEIEGAEAKSKEGAEAMEYDWQKLHDTLGRISGEFNSIGEAIGGLEGETLKTAGMIATKTATVINSITTLANWSVRATEMTAKGVSKSIQAVEKASVILAVISAVIQLVQEVSSLIENIGGEKQEEEAKKYRQEVEALNTTLAITKLRADEAGKALAIFSGDDYNKAISNVRLSEEAFKRYNDTLQKHVEDYNAAAQVIPLFGMGADLSKFETMAQKFGAIIGNMSVTTKEAKKFLFFEWGGESKRLKDLVPELFNPDKSIDMNALDKFIGSSTYEKLSDTAKRALNDLQKSHEEYKKSLKGVQDYLSSVFGNLGSGIMDKWVAEFRKGESAVEKFRQVVSGEMEKMMEDMIQNMIFSAVFSDVFKQAEKDLQELMSSGGSEADYIDYFSRLLGDLEAKGEEVEKRLKNAQKAGEKNGFDLFKDKEEVTRQASRGGISQSITQDTGEEISGRLTAMQGHTYIMSENSKIMTENSNLILTHVIGIHKNTDELQRLERIERDTSSLKAIVNTIEMKGLKLRN